MRAADFLKISILTQKCATCFLIISIYRKWNCPSSPPLHGRASPQGEATKRLTIFADFCGKQNSARGSLKRSCKKKPSPCLLKILHYKIFFDKNGKSFLTSSLPPGGLFSPNYRLKVVLAAWWLRSRRMRGAACFLIISILSQKCAACFLIISI